MQEHLKLLGFKVRDVVTGFEGVAESITFDLYGCVQALVRPQINKKKPTEKAECGWFDMKRLEAIGKSPVMKAPDFVTVPGGTSKPAATEKPVP